MQDKLDIIYKEIANKNASEWCIVIHNNWIREVITKLYPPSVERKRTLNIVKIIWHPIMLWDILKRMPKWPNFFDEIVPVVDLRIELDKPIDDQPIETIDFILKLIQDEKS
jgi:hypothetical protein